MSPTAFEDGSIVKLNSGGPLMTVTSTDFEAGLVLCTWFDEDTKLQTASYPPADLELAKV